MENTKTDSREMDYAERVWFNNIFGHFVLLKLKIIEVNCRFKLSKALFSVNKETTSVHLPSLQGASVSYSKDGSQVENHFMNSYSQCCEHRHSSYHPQEYQTMTATTNSTIPTVSIASAVKISHYDYFV